MTFRYSHDDYDSAYSEEDTGYPGDDLSDYEDYSEDADDEPPQAPMSPTASPISFYEYGSSNVVLSSTPPAENPRFRKVPSSDDVPEYSWLVLDVLDAAPTRARALVPSVPDTASMITPPFAWVWLDLLC